MSAIEELKDLALGIPALERQIAGISKGADDLRQSLKDKEALAVLNPTPLDGKNEAERKAQLALRLSADAQYQDCLKTIDEAEKMLLDKRQRLSEATHLWRVLDLQVQLQIADKQIMAGAKA